MQGGSADIDDDDVISMKSIVTKEPVTKLVTATKADPTLAAAKSLTDDFSEGYHWKQVLLFRTRMDTLGDKRE